MYQRVRYDFKQELIKIRDAGLFKEERAILSDQKPDIRVSFPMGSEPRSEPSGRAESTGAGYPRHHQPTPGQIRPGSE